MKRFFSVLFTLLFITGIFTGCKGTKANKEKGKLNIVTTIFPQYDWVREILGDNADNVNLTLLLDNGVDLHSYQPTADDIIKISTCDLFIYVGGESDKWVEDTLKGSINKDMITINLLEALGDAARVEEIVEGMQTDDHDHEDEDHDDEDHDHEHEDEHDKEYDEHVWLSLKNSIKLSTIICDSLSKIDKENKDKYTANLNAYTDKLTALDTEYKTVVDKSQLKTFLFGDRFPFRYLAEDYGLKYYAAFAGCSAETEASFETITFLSAKTDELGLDTVLTLEGSNHSIAKTIVSSTKSKNQQVLSLDSMQSVSLEDVEKGKTYLSIMEKNLEVLKTALK